MHNGRRTLAGQPSGLHSKLALQQETASDSPGGLHSKLAGQQETASDSQVSCTLCLRDSKWATLGLGLDDGLRIGLVVVVRTLCIVIEIFYVGVW